MSIDHTSEWKKPSNVPEVANLVVAIATGIAITRSRRLSGAGAVATLIGVPVASAAAARLYLHILRTDPTVAAARRQITSDQSTAIFADLLPGGDLRGYDREDLLAVYNTLHPLTVERWTARGVGLAVDVVLSAAATGKTRTLINVGIVGSIILITARPIGLNWLRNRLRTALAGRDIIVD